MRRPSNEPPFRPDGEEVDAFIRILEMADKTQDNIEKTGVKIGALRAGTSLIVVIFAVALPHLAESHLIPEFTLVIRQIIYAVLAFVALWCVEFFGIRKLKRTQSYEKRLLGRIVGFLREVEQSQSGSWTQLQRFEFMIRLSRFEI